MRYLALLRGINVGGKNRVDMPRLRESFDRLGYTDVVTYINSGNVVFTAGDDASGDHAGLVTAIEAELAADFGFPIRTLVLDRDTIAGVVAELPPSWVNDNVMKCDAMFLWDEVAGPDALERLTIRPGIDDVKYVNSTILWRIDRTNQSRSGQQKLAGTFVYRHMTIRNCNTLRKLAQLVAEEPGRG